MNGDSPGMEDRILDAIDTHYSDLQADIQALTAQVKETNGRVRALESWQQYMKGAADTLITIRDGKAWRLPAMTAFIASIVSTLIGALIYIGFGR